MHGIGKEHGLIPREVVQQRLVIGDGGRLLGRIELTGDRLGLAVLEPEPVQQGDQP
jgi:hypothetical protein